MKHWRTHQLPLIGCLGVLALAAEWLPAAEPSYVGSQACAACHDAEFQAWMGSHHDLAMQYASGDTVLGDFDDAEITVHGVTSRFFTRDGNFFVHTDGPDGAMADFEIAYTFGVDPLQQYLVPFADGRIQALSLAWDARPKSKGGQRWFHLYPGEAIGHGDELHWTGRQQNWNYMCADCHSTNYAKGYDIASNRFASTWSEIDVACEACHGPGKAHATWASADEQLRAADVRMGLALLLRDRQGVAWEMNPETGIAKRQPALAHGVEVGVCADCHSRRGTLMGGGLAKAEFLDHHMPAFLTEPLYFADGQINEEVYVWGSFLQSRMHAAGVTCSDCHEPHSLALRAEGDAVCSQCHLPGKFDTSAHHGHLGIDTSPGCLDCHMPERTYMVVDPRRDHSIRVPRPRLSANYDVPNACNGCHADRTVGWAVAAYERLFPQSGSIHQDWTAAFALSRRGVPEAEASLLGVIADEASPGIVRATAVVELAAFLSPASGEALEAALKDESALVRLASLRALEVLPPEHRFSFAGHALADPSLAIRAEAGRVLAATPPDALDRDSGATLRAAIDEYVATQRYNGDRPESWLNLGNLRARMGDFEQAEAEYRHAIETWPDFAGAYLNLADLFRFLGREPETVAVLRAGLSKRPRDAALHHALGLALVRGGDTQAALLELARATELAPGDARFAYVYAVGLNSAGRAGEAIETLAAAHARHPEDMQVLQALAVFERDRGNFGQARAWAERILALSPEDPFARQLLQGLP